MSSQETSREAVLEALRGVVDPQTRQDVVTLNLVRLVELRDGLVRVTFGLPPHMAAPPLQVQLREQVRAVVQRLPGVTAVDVEFLVVSERPAHGVPGVRHVVAVGAGKGGVGKSTVATLLAVGLARAGMKPGLLDADVYGPSLPKITGTERDQPMTDDSGRIFPPRFGDIPVLSMGHVVAPDQAVIWRGPMAQKYVKEFLDRGAWGELDVLIVDLPPGTGDIPLTLAQSIPLTGAVVVCTPQDVALLDAIKALRMYQKLGVEPLGLVENMSYYICPQCGHRAHIFDHGGCERAAAELGVPFLGSIPLNLSIRASGDAGRPFDNFERSEPIVASALTELAQRLIDQIARRQRDARPLPQLTIT